jgi:hypothetical protein
MNTPLDAGDGRRTDVVIDVTATSPNSLAGVAVTSITTQAADDAPTR